MYLSELINETAEAIRVHHASGHFDHVEADLRLRACGLSGSRIAELLAAPVGDDLFAKYKTWPVAGAR